MSKEILPVESEYIKAEIDRLRKEAFISGARKVREQGRANRWMKKAEALEQELIAVKAAYDSKAPDIKNIPDADLIAELKKRLDRTFPMRNSVMVEQFKNGAIVDAFFKKGK